MPFPEIPTIEAMEREPQTSVLQRLAETADSTARPIRVLSIMEADFVTGPAKNLIEFARRAGPDVQFSIAGYLRGGEPETKFLQAARAAGLDVHVLEEHGRFDRAVPGAIRDLVARVNPDIVQTHNVKSHFFLRASGVWRERKWLAFHHGYTSTDLKMHVYNLVDYWSLRRAYRMVTVCQPFVDLLVAKGVPRDHIRVQHNSVKPFAPLDAAPSRPWSEPLIVSIGRLSLEKGHVDLVEALGLLKQHGVAFHAVFVGEGPERPRIEAARDRLGLNDNTTLAGLQHDVRPYYEMADVIALPSHSEGSPNALLEAMIAGKAIAATRVGGVPEICEDQRSGLVVPSRDPKAMADALARLVGDPELRRRLGAEAHTTAATHYSPEAYRESMIGMYRELLGRAA